MVQLAQSALPVDEVGGGQLVQSFQSHRGGIPRVIAHLSLLAQLPFVHKNCQGLLSCKRAHFDHGIYQRSVSARDWLRTSSTTVEGGQAARTTLRMLGSDIKIKALISLVGYSGASGEETRRAAFVLTFSV